MQGPARATQIPPVLVSFISLAFMRRATTHTASAMRGNAIENSVSPVKNFYAIFINTGFPSRKSNFLFNKKILRRKGFPFKRSTIKNTPSNEKKKKKPISAPRPSKGKLSSFI